MSEAGGVLQITKRELLPRDTSVYQVKDGTIYYYKTTDPKKFYMNWRGAEKVARLEHNSNKCDYFGAHEDAVYFSSLTVGKIKKIQFLEPDVWDFIERDIFVGETLHDGALCSWVVNGATYVYRMCDDPRTAAVRLDWPPEQLAALRLVAIHRGIAIYLQEEPQLPEPFSRRLRENLIVLVVETGAAIAAPNSDPCLYIAHSNTFYMFDTQNVLFRKPLRISGGCITSIAGGMNEDGVINVVCFESGQSYLCSAKIPEDYFNSPEQLQEMQDKIDMIGRRIKAMENDTTGDELEETMRKLRKKFGLQEITDDDSDEGTSITQRGTGKEESKNEHLETLNKCTALETNKKQASMIRSVGGFGCVFEVFNKLDNWIYAVKRVSVDASDMQKALQEVRAMAQLDHPGIVRYNGTWIEQPPEGWQHDADVALLKSLELPRNHLKSSMTFRDDSVLIYIQMQLCNYSLSDWLKENIEPSTRDFARMKRWFKQVVEAVDYIHRNNLIHRDLKASLLLIPSNILFLETDLLKVCDLGIATERREEDQFESLKSRTDVGTKLYMSPEQLANRRYSSQTDVFSLGLILTELLVVMKPLLRSQIFDNYRRGVPNYLIEDGATARFIRHLTQTESRDRPTCGEMLDSLFLA